MFIINISDGDSRQSALYLLEFYDIKFQIERFGKKLRYIVYGKYDDCAVAFNNKSYDLAEMAFEMNWATSKANVCDVCNTRNLEHCGHKTFIYPLEV